MDKNLPVADFRDEILKSIKDEGNPITVVVAETGAGKTTQIPQYLLDEGYSCVVTQPRRLAAFSVAERVAEEYGCEIGDIVGYRTAGPRCDSDKTRCLFVTDGLALIRELVGAGNHDVLVIDEVHEWNLNIEVLVAWIKKQVEKNKNLKVVLMSATLEAEKLSKYFNNAPVIEVPGRTFPVEVQQPGESMVSDIVEFVEQEKNTLVFLPGKAEIENMKQSLLAKEVDAEILTLHGGLTKEQQSLVFKKYNRPVVVLSTNIAQTSVTVDYIDAVVDSGLERRVEVVNGVEGLYLRAISKADSAQRKGRAGRTKSGVYKNHCSEDQPDFPKAEIMRVRLDQTVLRLAKAGFDMEDLEFFHQPDIAEIHEAKRVLKTLGCMDENGNVTKVGKFVSKLPVSVKYARMVCEAEKYGVVGDVIKVASILEQGGIVAHKIEKDGQYVDASWYWQQHANGEKQSDILAQLNVYENTKGMSNALKYENGVLPKNCKFVKERIGLLEKNLKNSVSSFNSSGNREDILKAVLAGMVDHLYKKQYGEYVNGDLVSRQINNSSVVSGTEWIVGEPFDLEIQGRYDKFTINLINFATQVEPELLMQVAPQLVKKETGLDPRFCFEKETVVSTTKVFFNEILVQEFKTEDKNHPEAGKILDKRAWEIWQKPDIAFPPENTNKQDLQIPEISEKVYAYSEVNGEALIAYGTVYISGDSISTKWTRQVDVAIEWNEEAVIELEEFKKFFKAKESLDVLNARLAKIDLSGFETDSDRDICFEGKYLKLTGETLKLVEDYVLKSEEEFAKKQEQARLVESGGYTEFEGVWWRRCGSNNGDGWVILPDGTLQEHDTILHSKPRRTHDGCKKWNVVPKDALALTWRKRTNASEHEFEVVCLPEVVTEQQVKTMEKLLKELEGEFAGKTGLASGKSSPGVGKGWCNPKTGESLTLEFTKEKPKQHKKQKSEQENKTSSSPFAILKGFFQ